MIRFVDLRPFESLRRFAFYNTCTLGFVVDDDDREAWMNWDDFAQHMDCGDDILKHYRSLCPPWVFADEETQKREHAAINESGFSADVELIAARDEALMRAGRAEAALETLDRETAEEHRQLMSVSGALCDAATVPVEPYEDGVRLLTKQRDDAVKLAEARLAFLRRYGQHADRCTYALKGTCSCGLHEAIGDGDVG